MWISFFASPDFSGARLARRPPGTSPSSTRGAIQRSPGGPRRPSGGPRSFARSFLPRRPVVVSRRNRDGRFSAVFGPRGPSTGPGTVKRRFRTERWSRGRSPDFWRPTLRKNRDVAAAVVVVPSSSSSSSSFLAIFSAKNGFWPSGSGRILATLGFRRPSTGPGAVKHRPRTKNRPRGSCRDLQGPRLRGVRRTS